MKSVILVCTLATGMAWAQSPQVVQNVRNSLNTVQKNATAASNQALGIKPATAAAKSSPAAAKTAPASSPVKIVPTKTATAAAKAPAPAAHKGQASAQPKLAVKPVAVKPAAVKKEAKATLPKKPEAAPQAAAAAVASSSEDSAAPSEEVKSDDSADNDKQDKKWSMAGKRDPFISPVVNHTGGSGCSTGKKCLEIGAINLRGVVHSDAGFIAVVTNSLNKAYFLRENDPVFDGYVVKITGDSIVFKETVQDRLGKTFTREVVKKIATPAV
jgi:hypothetical protein